MQNLYGLTDSQMYTVYREVKISGLIEDFEEMLAEEIANYNDNVVGIIRKRFNARKLAITFLENYECSIPCDFQKREQFNRYINKLLD